ncbi:MAG TPA: hypothetical protein VIG97_02035 [Luteimonas sp.]
MTAHSHAVSPCVQRRTASDHAPDWAGRLVVALAFLAVVAMLSLPQARNASPTFGWLPLWLAGLPAAAGLALAAARRRAGG